MANPGRVRGSNGQFVPSASSGRLRISLLNHSRCQKAYIARRDREKKIVVVGFLKDFIVKGENENLHWLPGSKDEGPLLECFDSLIVKTSHDSGVKLLSYAKRIYFAGKSNPTKRRLPRITVQENSQPEKDGKRVPAFRGWRFPYPDDIFEMELVETWLKRHRRHLKVSINESKDTCIKLFSRYRKHPKRYRFVGYPVRSVTLKATIDFHLTAPDNGNTPDQMSVTNSVDRVTEATACPSSNQEAEQLDADKLVASAREIMKMATNDVYYRTLSLVLNPSCSAHLDIVCFLYVSQIRKGELPNEWCDLQRTVFQYCVYVQERKTETEMCQNLQKRLNDQLETFKLIRQSAGLPLYGETSSSFCITPDSNNA